MKGQKRGSIRCNFNRGAVEFINEEILDQLKSGGRIMAVFREKSFRSM